MLALQQLLLFHLTLDSMQLELESNLELNLELKLNPDLNLDSFLGFTQGVLAEYGVIQHDSFTCV